jgi:hypothetical protein
MRNGAVLLLVGMALASEPARPPSPLRLGDRPLSSRPVRYRIEARLWPEKSEVTGRLSLSLRNTSRVPLRRACLHLYLNAFASPDTTFMRESGGTMRVSRFDAAQPGGIEVSELKQGSRAVGSRKILDGTVLEATLPEPVQAGADLKLELAFRSRLPRVFARTGRAGDFFMVAQWYPKPGVLRDDGSWHCPAFHARAEFFADFGTYEVTLRVPRRFRVGATGIQTDESGFADELRELRFRAADVHDFAWTAWPHFERHARSVDGVEVELLTVPGRGQAERELWLVEEALPRLQRWLGPYPYRRLTVVDVPTPALGAGGMEYPTLLTTWIPWFAPGWLHAFDETTVHELVHQYFQGMVASNEVLEPWLDEGVTSYVTGLLLDELFGADRGWADLGALRLSNEQKEQLRITGRHAEASPLGWPAPRFDSWWSYGRTVYARAALLLRTVESLLGREAMRAALADYVRAFSFRHPTSADLERALLARAPAGARRALEHLLDGAIRRADDLDYAVSCGCDEVRVRRRGRLALPLEVQVWTDRGERSFSLSGEDAEERLHVPGLRRARLGPPGRLTLDHTPADLACTRSSLPARAALGWATWAQPLLQVLGP